MGDGAKYAVANAGAGTLKINVDGTFSQESGMGATGAVL
jgi:hypothetical protein